MHLLPAVTQLLRGYQMSEYRMPPYTTAQQLPLDSEYTPEDTLNYSLIGDSIKVFRDAHDTVDTLPAIPSLGPIEALEGSTVYVTGIATIPDGVYTLGYNADLGLLITEGNDTRDVHYGTNALDTFPNDDYDPGINHR